MADRHYGGFWRRLLAYIIDQIILDVIALLLLAIGLAALGRGGVSFWRIAAAGDIPREMELFVVLYLAAITVISMAYFTWFHGSVGRTPGKMLLGLRVIQASGEPMTFGIAFLRWVGSLVSGLCLWLGYLWVAFDKRKQGWHDKIAATCVVRISREPAPGPTPVPQYPAVVSSILPLATSPPPEPPVSSLDPDRIVVEQPPAAAPPAPIMHEPGIADRDSPGQRKLRADPSASQNDGRG